MLKKQFTGLIFTTIIVMAISVINVVAADDWKSKYRDVQQVEGTEYFLIHLYDVEIGGETWYASGIADKDGNIVLPVEYAYIDTVNLSDGRRLMSTFGKNGYVDENFKIVIEPVYDWALPFEKGSAKVQKKNPDGTGRVFYIDKDGNEVPDPTPEAERNFEYYMSRASQELNMFIYPRIGKSDFAVCSPQGGDIKFGIINVMTREYLSPRKWDSIIVNEAGEVWAQIKNDGGSYDTYIIGLDGIEEFKFKSERITTVWENDLITFCVYKPVKQVDYGYSADTLFDAEILMSGLMDKNGKVIIQPAWETPNPGAWSDEYQMCRDGYLTGMQGSKNYEYSKGMGTEGDGKWGCVDTTGVVVIEPIYDNLRYMGYGRFYGETARGYSILDSHGKALPKPPYSFSLTGTVPSAWATGEVAEAFELGLVKSDDKIDFDQHTYQWNITRQQFCELAVNMFIKVKGKDAIPEITDTSAFTDTRNESVLAAYELGIVGGKGKGIFDPFSEITRQEAATMLTNLAAVLDISPTAESLTFEDETDFASWAKDSIVTVTTIQNGGQRVMNGVGNNRFAPLSPYTVEQAIITVLHLYKSYPEV